MAMRFLRTVPTRRLLAMIVGLVVVAVGGTAIAIAAAGNGPVPPPASLADAIHGALGAAPVNGLSARISFTNNLISSSDIVNSDPIITGASGRLWIGADAIRLELQSTNGDAQVLVDHDSFWIYDPSTNTVYKGSMPAAKSGSTGTGDTTGTKQSDAVPSIDQIQSDLTKLAAHLDISGPTPSDFGGAAAYTVRVSPKHDGGLLGAAQLAWDAARGVPLDFALYASGNSSPVLELQVTGITYGTVSPSVFAISPPSSATVVKVAAPPSTAAGAVSPARHSAATKGKGMRGAERAAKRLREVTGVRAVAAQLRFSLNAPARLAGLPRRSVELLDWGSSPAALALYGQGLGGVAVVEHTAPSSSSSSASSTASPNSGQNGGGSGLNLPTVSIKGVTGHELDTALGTAVEFTRGGVSYLVIGSVPAVAAEAAARAL
jgi:outer membrane lipoprotein-sorting protein